MKRLGLTGALTIVALLALTRSAAAAGALNPLLPAVGVSADGKTVAAVKTAAPSAGDPGLVVRCIGCGGGGGGGAVDQGAAGLDAWLFNLGQINGTTILTGNGITGAGSPRFTIANDTNWLPDVADRSGRLLGVVSAASWPLPTGAATETGHLATIDSNIASIKAKTDNLDVALSTRTKPADSQTVSGSVTANIGSTNGVALDATLTGGTAKAIARGAAKGATGAADATVTANGLDHSALDVQLWLSGSALDPRSIRLLTSSDVVSAVQSGAWAVAATQSGSWTDDVTDRAARLLGVVYGSRGQQLVQTATNFNLQAELAVGGTLVDPRSIRALTSADVVSAAQSGTWNITNVSGTVSLPTGAATSAAQTDGSQKAIARGGAKGATTAADVTSTSIDADHNAMDVSVKGTATIAGTATVTQGPAGTDPWPVAGRDPSGTTRGIATSPGGVVYVFAMQPPLNPFLPRCNPVRRMNCQP